MKKLTIIIFYLFSSFIAMAQTTAVTATITDSDSTVWINPQWSVQFVPNPNFPNLNSYSIAGVPITSNTYSQYIQVNGTGNGSGAITTTLLDNGQVLPAGSTYRFVVQSQTSAPATTYAPIKVTGASQSLTSYLSSNSIAPRFSAAAPGAFGYADIEISITPQPGGLYYNTIAANQRIWSGTAWGTNGGSSSGGPAYVYLSCATELGTQMNAANTTLSGKGIIQLPNCTTATMTTTATALPQGISIQGYGKLGTKITCSVAGDCINTSMNPTTQGEIGSEISGFEIDGSGASNQVLLHANGMSGYTLHDIEFQPYGGSGNSAICLWFDNATSGQFTERNRTYSIELERQCTTGALFSVESGTPSFAYNTFEFGTVSQGSNFALVFNGSGRLYGGSLTVTANHVGPGGGILQFNNDFGATGAAGMPGEHLFVTAEENGSGAGVVLAATSTSVLQFEGSILNGGGGANPLATLTSIAAGSSYHIFGSSAASSVSTGNSTSTTTVPGGLTISACCGSGTSVSGTLNLVPAGNPVTLIAPTYSLIPSNGANLLEFQVSGAGIGGSTLPFLIYGAPFAGNNAATGPSIPANGVWQWSSTNAGFTIDTGISRTATGAIAIGNGTQGNDSGTIDATVYKTGGVAGVTKTCTSAIVVVSGIITGCT